MAFYFQNAFGIDASPAAVDSERALVNALADNLAPSDAAVALSLVGDGGPADEIVTLGSGSAIRTFSPTLRNSARAVHSPGA